MLQKIKYRLCFVMLVLCSHALGQEIPQPGLTDAIGETNTVANAEDMVPSMVREIIITGNKRTRPDIILREIPFKPGEKYALQELVRKFEDARRQLMNTALFHEVIVAMQKSEGYLVDVLVEVKERWYIFPVPYFKPVDRNLNQWLFEKGASLSRVNYGLKVLHNNATGHNDKLRFWFVAGYTKQLSFSYDRLYIDKKNEVGSHHRLCHWKKTGK